MADNTLNYAKPGRRIGPHILATSLVFSACWFASSIATDYAVHRVTGSISDGGGMIIMWKAWVPATSLAIVAKAILRRRVRVSWTGAAGAGALGPPAIIALLVMCGIV